MRYGPGYADLPEAFLNLDILLDHHGDDTLNAIWTEVWRWATEPRRLHRAYTVDYLATILRLAIPDPRAVDLSHVPAGTGPEPPP